MWRSRVIVGASDPLIRIGSTVDRFLPIGNRLWHSYLLPTVVSNRSGFSVKADGNDLCGKIRGHPSILVPEGKEIRTLKSREKQQHGIMRDVINPATVHCNIFDPGNKRCR